MFPTPQHSEASTPTSRGPTRSNQLLTSAAEIPGSDTEMQMEESKTQNVNNNKQEMNKAECNP
jgi:hypothetical protein